MKYLAILRDSFREARDTWSLSVLFCLATAAILFVASISFRPLPAEDTFSMFVNGKIRIILNVHRPEVSPEVQKAFKVGPRIDALLRLEKVDQIDGLVDSPLGEYVLTISHAAIEPQDMKQPFKVGKFFGKENARHETKLPPPTEVDQKDFKLPPPEVEPVRQAVPLLSPEEYRKLARADVDEVFAQAKELDLISVKKIEFVDEVQGLSGSHKIRYRVTVAGTAGTRRLWVHEMSVFFGSWPWRAFNNSLGFQVFELSVRVIGVGSWGAVLLGIIITSFFIPNMMRKGTVDLLVSKPLPRWALLTYKYVGGLSFIFLVTAYAIAGVWLVIGIRTGLWGWETLLLIPTLTFSFAILYAVSVLTGVLTRSAITCILVTFTAWILFYSIGAADQGFREFSKIEKMMDVPESERWGDGNLSWAIQTLNMVTPRTADLNRLNVMIMYCSYVTGDLGNLKYFTEGDHPWWESLLVSTSWIVVFVGLACWRFSVTDY